MSRPSILRLLMVELALLEGDESDPVDFLDRAALLVREAGLEHMVSEATLLEVEALARAGSGLDVARSARHAVDARDPAAALAPFDHGAAVRRELVEAMSGPLEKGQG